MTFGKLGRLLLLNVGFMAAHPALAGSQSLFRDGFEEEPLGLPACTASSLSTSDWTRIEENGFAFTIPPGAEAIPRTLGLDHELGQWEWDDGRALQFEYGFAVTELADWLDEDFVTGCRTQLDGVDAGFLERRDPNGQFFWAIGLFDYVQSYAGGTPGLEKPVAHDLAIIGIGNSEAVFAEGRALLESFRWSRIPDSALAAWSVQGASDNTVLVFEAPGGATALMLATFRQGAPHWLMGVPPGPMMSYRHGPNRDSVSVPLTLYEGSDGVAPGDPDHPATFIPFADAVFTVSLVDCQSAELRYVQLETGKAEYLSLHRTNPFLDLCTPFRK